MIARIKAVLRRFGKNDENQVKEVKYDKLSINLTNYELKVNGKVVDTPPKEMELIYHLASNPNRVFTRDQLLDEVWGSTITATAVRWTSMSSACAKS